MPLLNKRLLTGSLERHQTSISNTNLEALKELFQATIARIENGKFGKEESEKVPFLQKMFELLGYKLHQNLQFEYSTSGRSVDGVLGNFDSDKKSVEVALEWKGIDTKNLDGGKAGETPVSQMWDYMGKVGAEIGIVGNFLEFRLYTLKTKQSNFHSFFIRELSQNQNKLLELVFLLSPATLLKSQSKTCLLEEMVSQSQAEQEQITKRFYTDYKQRRLNLFHHLIENNPEIDKILLLEKSQKVLDRLIFIMFCEDSFLLPNKLINQTFEQGKSNRSRSETKIWEQFQYIFEDIDVGRYDINPQINAFNGGLFASDDTLNSLKIKDDVWVDLIKLAQYDFSSDLNVNILGHIFEQSIADIEEIKASLDGQSPDTKKSKRKKDGIYYTPEYITDYIVSQTVGAWLSENPDKLDAITVLDPAGGSGAFPNQVHNFLTKKQVEKANQIAIEAGLGNFAQLDANQIDKSILKNNIFMVDLQPESVEIAKLSLWLKTAKKDQKLNNLDENVKCGNSLIDDPQIAGDRAFDWQAKFPEVMADSGFDVVVGNPPYVTLALGKNQDKSDTKLLDYYKNNYANSMEYKGNLFAIFIERGVNLLNFGGYLSFIVPNTLLLSLSFSKIRKFILENCDIKSILNLKYEVFEDANTGGTCIFVIKKVEIPNQKNILNYSEIESEEQFKNKEYIDILQEEFYKDEFHRFSGLQDTIEKKIKNETVKLGDLGKFYNGIKTGDNKKFLAETKIDNSYLPVIRGRDIEKYLTNFNSIYILFDKTKLWSNFDESKLSKNPKIIIRQTGDSITATLDTFGYYTMDTTHIFYDSAVDIKYILGVLNSNVFTQIFRESVAEQGKAFAEVKIVILKTLPIPTATTEQQIQIAELVDKIMELKKTSQNLVNRFLKLVNTKYKPAAISARLKKWHNLETGDFLDELKKQKAQIGGLANEAELMTYFESEKIEVLELGRQVESVDAVIEGLVIGLYGVKN